MVGVRGLKPPPHFRAILDDGHDDFLVYAKKSTVFHNIANLLPYLTRYRDISFHTMSQKGIQMKDALMTIIQTAKKLSVNTYEYLYERITKTYRLLLLLACLIQEKAQQNLATVPIFNKA